MTRRRDGLGAACSMRNTLASFLFAAFLTGFISIWQIHSNYLGRSGSDSWGTSNIDASLAGAWLPEPPSTSIRGGRKKGGRNDAGRRKKRKGSPTKKQSSIAESSVTKVIPERNRVYCMVPFIWTPSALHAYHAIQASWGKRCHILRFFIDPVIGDEEIGFYNMTDAAGVIAAEKAGLILPDDVVILHDMKRPWHTCGSQENEENNKPIGNCRNIFEKVWRMIVHVAYGLDGSRDGGEHGSNASGAEWFVKVDSDTFLFPENVGRYVEARKWSHDDHHYFGHVLNHRKDDRGVSIVAGGAVFFSRATLLAGADAFRRMPMDEGNEEEDGTCRDAYTGTEEVVTAICLKEHSNITAEPAIDPEGREQVSLYEVDIMLGYNRTDQGEWWFWQDKQRFPCHDDGDCLASLPLAFHHYKDSQIFLDFEKEFYGSIMKGEEDPKLIRTKNGRVAARHWPHFDQTHRYFERVRAAMKAAGSEIEDGSERQEEKNNLEIATKKKQSTFKQPSNNRRISSMRNKKSTKKELPANTQQTNRVYCMVPFIWTPSAFQVYHAIHASWGKRCHILNFFIDPVIGDEKVGFYNMTEAAGVIAAEKANLALPDDVVILHDMKRPWHASCPNKNRLKEFGNCRNIWEKIWRMMVYVADGSGGASAGGGRRTEEDDTGADMAEWFVKVDSDTFLFPENVGRYVEARKWSHDDQHYFGHVLSHRKDDRGVSTVAGGAVFYSRAALLAGADAFRRMPMDKGNKEEDGTCRDAYTGTEEMITAICLKKHGISAEPAIDPEGREHVSLYEVDDIIKYNRTDQGEWWFWKNKKRFPCHDDGDCLAYLPLAFHHYKDSRDFLNLEKEFYGSVMKGEKDPKLIRTKDGRVAARRWPNFDVTHQYFERVRAAMKAVEYEDSQTLAISNVQQLRQTENLKI